MSLVELLGNGDVVPSMARSRSEACERLINCSSVGARLNSTKLDWQFAEDVA